MKIYFTIAIAIIMVSCNGDNRSYKVKEKIINEAVYASGEIYPAAYDFPRAGATERILKILVEVGDTVNPGDILAVLGTPSENIQLNILTEQVALARQNRSENSAILRELKSKIQLARQKYKQDSLNAERYSALVKDQAVSQKDAQEVLLQAEASLTEYIALQQQYDVRKNELSARLLNAEQQLAQHRQFREGKILKSRVKGKVYNIYIEEGELAEVDEPVLMVGSVNKFKLELLVDERDISKIKLGQKVYFETDAFGEEKFEAEVTKIVPVLQKESRSFKVEAMVLKQRSFYPQSAVEANILIREDVKALVIPAVYLMEGDSVKVEQNGSERKIQIVRGTRNEDWVEVKKGLKAGDIVIMND